MKGPVETGGPSPAGPEKAPGEKVGPGRADECATGRKKKERVAKSSAAMAAAGSAEPAAENWFEAIVGAADAPSVAAPHSRIPAAQPPVGEHAPSASPAPDTASARQRRAARRAARAKASSVAGRVSKETAKRATGKSAPAEKAKEGAREEDAERGAELPARQSAERMAASAAAAYRGSATVLSRGAAGTAAWASERVRRMPAIDRFLTGRRSKREARVARRAARREAGLASLGLGGAAGGAGGAYGLRMLAARLRAQRKASPTPLASLGRRAATLCLTALSSLVLLALIISYAVGASQAPRKQRGRSCEAYIAQAQKYAADDSIGYSMRTRFHNPNMDCSSFVYYSMVDSGYATTATLGSSPFSTANMASYLMAAGFSQVEWDGSADSLERGDVLINTGSHTEIYLGANRCIGAHRDLDGLDGDSSGDEVSEGGYYDGGWNVVMRPPASTAGHGALTGVAAEVYDALASYGFTDEAIAGVLGNMQAESGMDPTRDGDDGTGIGAVSLGLMQLTDYGGDRERSAFLEWCSANGKQWDTATAQMEWTFSGEAGTSSYSLRWSSPSRVRDGYASAPGYRQEFGSSWYRTADDYRVAADVDLAAFSWMACYEGCATGYLSHLDKRIAYAEAFLSQIQAGGGEEYSQASEGQRAIVDTCRRVQSPGAGFCAQWVSQVFQAAGHPYYGGNACDMYADWCTSADRSELKVGMVVATPSSSSGTNAGLVYGHIGIYIGDGMVMHNTGQIEETSLDSWIETYCKYHEPAWGWLGGVSLE